MDYTKKIPGARTKSEGFVICQECHRTGMIRLNNGERGKFTIVIHSLDEYGQANDVCMIKSQPDEVLLGYMRRIKPNSLEKPLPDTSTKATPIAAPNKPKTVLDKQKERQKRINRLNRFP